MNNANSNYFIQRIDTFRALNSSQTETPQVLNKIDLNVHTKCHYTYLAYHILSLIQ